MTVRRLPSRRPRRNMRRRLTGISLSANTAPDRPQRYRRFTPNCRAPGPTGTDPLPLGTGSGTDGERPAGSGSIPSRSGRRPLEFLLEARQGGPHALVVGLRPRPGDLAGEYAPEYVRTVPTLVQPGLGYLGAPVDRGEPVAPPRHRHPERRHVERELLGGPGGDHLAGGEPYPRPTPVQAHEPGGCPVTPRPDQRSEPLGAPPRHPFHIRYGPVHIGGRDADGNAFCEFIRHESPPL